MRRSTIHSCPVCPVLRLTSVVRWPRTRQAYRPRHVLERDTLAVALLDETEDLGEERLVLAGGHPRRQPLAAPRPRAGASGAKGQPLGSRHASGGARGQGPLGARTTRGGLREAPSSVGRLLPRTARRGRAAGGPAWRDRCPRYGSARLRIFPASWAIISLLTAELPYDTLVTVWGVATRLSGRAARPSVRGFAPGRPLALGERDGRDHRRQVRPW